MGLCRHAAPTGASHLHHVVLVYTAQHETHCDTPVSADGEHLANHQVIRAANFGASFRNMLRIQAWRPQCESTRPIREASEAAQNKANNLSRRDEGATSSNGQDA
jgi:hypothetical protein